MEILRADNLSAKFDYMLFENLNLSIHSSQSIAILGVSGCGKSTLLHILSTLLKPKNGEVIYKKKSIYKLSGDERLAIRRRDFGIIFQSHYLFKGFDTYENIELASILSGKKIRAEILDRLKISQNLSQKVGELSGGQQQRVSIARVLCKEPKIIFADEPTGNLDKDTANDVMDVLFDYVRQNLAALVLVTHDENLAQKCAQIYKLTNKRLEQWK